MQYQMFNLYFMLQWPMNQVKRTLGVSAAQVSLACEIRTGLYLLWQNHSGFKLGLLVNFGHYPKVQLERIVAEKGRYRFGGK